MYAEDFGRGAATQFERHIRSFGTTDTRAGGSRRRFHT
jgi:hypothetical protein